MQGPRLGEEIATRKEVFFFFEVAIRQILAMIKEITAYSGGRQSTNDTAKRREAVRNRNASPNHEGSVSTWVPGGINSRSGTMLRRCQCPAVEAQGEGRQNLSSA